MNILTLLNNYTPEILIALMILGLIGATFNVVMLMIYNIQDYLNKRG